MSQSSTSGAGVLTSGPITPLTTSVPPAMSIRTQVQPTGASAPENKSPSGPPASIAQLLGKKLGDFSNCLSTFATETKEEGTNTKRKLEEFGDQLSELRSEFEELRAKVLDMSAAMEQEINRRVERHLQDINKWRHGMDCKLDGIALKVAKRAGGGNSKKRKTLGGEDEEVRDGGFISNDDSLYTPPNANGEGEKGKSSQEFQSKIIRLKVPPSRQVDKGLNITTANKPSPTKPEFSVKHEK